MSHSMDEALQAFITESLDLLEKMEAALLEIEQRPDDAETLNAVFRAAHTIKGSAGIFGLNDIVAFTHVAENVLDEARKGHVRFDAQLSSLFLAVGDHIRELVHLVVHGRAQDADGQARGDALVQRMQAILGRGGKPEPSAEAVSEPATASSDGAAVPAGGVHSDNWHLSLRFGIDTIRDGFDPLSFVRYLCTLGQIDQIITVTDSVPALSDLEPDACHLGFEINLRTDVDKATIEGAFDFIRNDSLVRILPPHSKVSEYTALIAALPEPDLRLGEMLVRCGTLTQAELDAALDAQTVSACEGKPMVALGQLLVDNQQVRPEVVDAALARQTQLREGRSQGETHMLRVDAAKLDHLIDLVGELIIAGAGANLIARKHKIKDLIQSTYEVARLMEEVRDSALNLRMVQIGGTFNRFQRVVRDVSQELGKDIALQITGAETELDKTVVEQLADPLTHLVRNAMDHGIESAERRATANKPAQGTVGLHARHEAGQVVIEVTDDGGGLGKARILSKAIERGLVAPDASLSDKDIFNLVFQPGFSTAEQISKLSGRGVGMDVVKRSITALRGSIDLSSTEGVGTTVCIRLPLTLAIIDGFLMGVGKSAYVVPLSMVVECIEMSRQQASGKDWLDLRGEVLPLVRLRELYEIDGEPGRRQNVVVVQGGGKRVGLVVDQLMGELQTVIKPLGKVFQNVRGVGGFTILGTGAVALLLDVPNLVAQVTDDCEAGFLHKRLSTLPGPPSLTSPRPALLDAL
ncbi:MAG: chemotaxis protein CheA [Aquabacterium sp.]|uniref:chemotaxis protein CheA n=1 Tax=Aquabacterium sp. TaxID=1872578 RepID=UPI0025B96253|nr:chemotaxis protein CheA [Aquabacterium sp.]MBI3382224.1 chemotaxis protein CheA [Aquabacterium sp.]